MTEASVSEAGNTQKTLLAIGGAHVDRIGLLRDIAAGRETVGDTTTLEDYSVLAKLRKDDD